MCNKRTCKTRWARRTRAYTLKSSSTIQSQVNTVSASAYISVSLKRKKKGKKKRKRFQGTTHPMRKLGAFWGETPHLSSSRWLLLFERKSLLRLRESHRFLMYAWADKTLREPDSTSTFHKGGGHYPALPPPSLSPSTQLQWNPKPSAMAVHWKDASTPAALNPPRVVEVLLGKPQCSVACPSLLRWTMPPTQLEKEKTPVIKLSLRLSSRVLSSLTKKQNTCKRGIPCGPCGCRSIG